MRELKPRSLFQYGLIAAVLIYAAVLLLVPMATLAQRTFSAGLEPIFTTFSDPDLQAALRMTVFLVVGATIINTVVGVLIAWVLARHEFPGKRLFNALVDLPFVASPVVIGFVVIMLFGRSGWLSNLPFQIAFAWPGMLLVTVFVSLPFVVREVGPVLEAFGHEQEEAAYTLGAGRFTTFRRIVLPAIRHGVIYGVVLTIARSLGEFGGVAAAGGGIQGITETATVYIYRSMSDRNNIGAYSLSLLLGLVAVIILILMTVLKPQHDELPATPSEE
jgi:sulfate/thiosulfate transport system permease protein